MTALDELKKHDHWVCWKYVWKPGAKKPSKPPIVPHTGRMASVAKSEEWASYADAEHFARRRRLEGVGFVLTNDLDLTGIDLDNVSNPDGSFVDWVQEILDLRETYAEISPSGTGIRMWARGSSPVVKLDKAGVEIYSDRRFLTWTGRHVDGMPDDILPAPETLRLLNERVAKIRGESQADEPGGGARAARERPSPAPRAPTPAGGDFFRNVNDAALLNLEAWVRELFPKARRSANGAYRVTSRDLGRNLQEDLSITPQGIQDFGLEQSMTAVDLALDHGNFDKSITAALWLCEVLRIEPARLGYTDAESGESVDASVEALIRENEDGTSDVIDAETGERIEVADATSRTEFDFPEHLTHVPGLMGEIIAYTLRTGSVHCRAFALTTAIGVMSAVSGRVWKGPTQAATNLFLMLLAPTGTGKDMVNGGIPKILTADADLARTNGASRFMSETAIYKRVETTPCSLAVIDEFGAMMRKVSNKRAATHEAAITSALRLLWSANFKSVNTPDYAQSIGITLHAPHFGMVGIATHRDLLGSLSGDEVLNGFLNRYLMISVSSRPPKNRDKLDEEVPDSIIAQLKQIYGRGDSHILDVLQNSDAIPPVYTIPWDCDATKDIWEDDAARIIREGDADEESEPYYARTAEMGVRLATLYALSVDQEYPVIDQQALNWGLAVAHYSADAMRAMVADHISETTFQGEAMRVKRVIKAHPRGITTQELAQKLGYRQSARDLKIVLDTLIDGGTCVRTKQRTGAPGRPAERYFYVKGK
jgi:hypothetical protein